jgi:hypothetical protein
MRKMLATMTVVATAICVETASANEAPLPLERVRLYETGVGYFERGGAMRAASMSLPVPAGHLDDALKTLVVLAPDGAATVSGITFASSVSPAMGRALAGLSPEDGTVDYADLLASLRGAPVEVKTDKDRIRGRLIDLEAAPPGGRKRCETRLDSGKEVATCITDHEAMLLVLADDGSLRRVRMGEVTSVRATDEAWSKRVGSALDALSDGKKRPRPVSVAGTPGAPIRLGYIAEAPVWRSTYRLVLAQNDDPAVLQGWALLHNDSDEDWKKVRVELVNGRPDSFLFPLAAPRYAHRELVTPDDELSTVPQLLTQTADEMGDSWGAAGLGLSGVGYGGGGHGEGIGLGSIGTIGHGAGARGTDGVSSLVSVGNLAAVAGAEGTEQGALFNYALPPVDLASHSSALLPFVNEKIGVGRLAFFSGPGATARTAVELDNRTKQTFPAGVISVFADGGFAGETVLSRTKPGEIRILQFGTDLDVDLERTAHAADDEPRVLLRAGEGLDLHFVRHHTVTYAIDNKSGAGRRVSFPLSFVHNAEVKGADDLVFDAETQQVLAIFDVAGQTRARRELTVREGLRRHVPEIDLAVLEELAGAAALPEGQRAILEKAKSHLQEAAGHRRALTVKRGELAKKRRSLAGLRESVRALGDRKEGKGLVDRLLAAEKSVEKLEKQIEALERARRVARAACHAALDELGAHAK